MNRKLSIASRTVILLVLALVVVLGAATSTSAMVSMSPDKVTCTPCHTDGRLGDGKGGEIPPPAKEGEGSAATPTAPAVDQKILDLKTTTLGKLSVAPAAEWDDLWTWVGVQKPQEIPNVYDDLYK